MMGQCGLPIERKKDWIGALLINSFGYCKKHKELRFNEKNVFCVDCGVSLCRHGKEDHSLHRRVKIYRYCYQDVVRSSDLQKYYDCSNIQTYISNNDKIVHLKPRPSIKDIKQAKRINFAIPNPNHESQSIKAKMSTPQKPGGGACEECGKHLQDKRNRFCSIACKISVVQEEPVNQNDNQNSETESSSISVAEPYEFVEKVNFRKRPRKTIPLRSPSSFIC